ncbi:MAG: hypothetical protein AAB497_00560 [Patescibacteria group bacterium]
MKKFNEKKREWSDGSIGVKMEVTLLIAALLASALIYLSLDLTADFLLWFVSTLK